MKEKNIEKVIAYINLFAEARPISLFNHLDFLYCRLFHMFRCSNMFVFSTLADFFPWFDAFLSIFQCPIFSCLSANVSQFILLISKLRPRCPSSLNLRVKLITNQSLFHFSAQKTVQNLSPNAVHQISPQTVNSLIWISISKMSTSLMFHFHRID